MIYTSNGKRNESKKENVGANAEPDRRTRVKVRVGCVGGLVGIKSSALPLQDQPSPFVLVSHHPLFLMADRSTGTIFIRNNRSLDVRVSRHDGSELQKGCVGVRGWEMSNGVLDPVA